MSDRDPGHHASANRISPDLDRVVDPFMGNIQAEEFFAVTTDKVNGMSVDEVSRVSFFMRFLFTVPPVMSAVVAVITARNGFTPDQRLKPLEA